MAGSVPDEDESILDRADQLKRPRDEALRQQRVLAWHPYLDPNWVIITLFLMGLCFIPTGFYLRDQSENIVQLKLTYDNYEDYSEGGTIGECGIDEDHNMGWLKGKNCTLSFTVPSDMDPPILIHYEIENFYQNHRDYYLNRNDEQLIGMARSSQSQVYVDACKPLQNLGGIELNPCGLVANTFFNDVIELDKVIEPDKGVSSEPLVMLQDGIAWQSDLKYKYAQPEGFKAEVCIACDDTCCDNEDWPCKEDETAYLYVDPNGVDPDGNGTCYRFSYPEENTTQYLYETYPMKINPLEGITNEHFVVWMRTAAQPKFRKLYGFINQPIAKGTILNFSVQPNWVVKTFEGKKSLILSTNSAFGGRNDWLGRYFIAFGIFCIAAGSFFVCKNILKPRKIADKRYLRFKEE